jgi:large subunit ribosomal protein L7/L12
MTPDEIRDEIAKIRNTDVLSNLENFCEDLKLTLKTATPILDKYDITLTRKVVKEKDLPPIGKSTFRKDWAVVFLSHADTKKIHAIKTIREATGLGLKEAKELVEQHDSVIKSFVTKKEAEEFEEYWFGNSSYIGTHIEEI